MPVQDMTVQELQSKLQQGENLLLLDVREVSEYRRAHIAGSVLMPMQQVPVRLDELPKERPIVVICHHGMRSRQVADYLVHYDYRQIFNLSGGIDAWSREIDAAVSRY